MDVSELGVGANDSQLITWCKQNGLVFVTKDWKSSSEPFITSQLKSLGVSAMWVRHDRLHNLASVDLLYVAARDLRKAIPIIEAATEPVYFECRLGVSARRIVVPTPRRRRVRKRRA